MRGKQEPDLCKVAEMRNIPAHAGKTRTNICGSFRSREHPRACGENANQADAEFCRVGTSPRMRGKLTGSNAETMELGNIPAHAGKTYLRGHAHRNPQEHPRACGENRGEIAGIAGELGTSPRMRGKPQCFLNLFIGHRNIPAHAGKTPRPTPQMVG